MSGRGPRRRATGSDGSRPRYRPMAQGRHARADPRGPARLAFHQDRERQRERPDAGDQREARVHLRLADHALAAADRRRTEDPRGSRSPRESLSPENYLFSPFRRDASLPMISARSTPRSDFAIALPSAAVRTTVSVSFEAPDGSMTVRLSMLPSGAEIGRAHV